MKCPHCGHQDCVYEVGTMTVMYNILGTCKDGTLEYGDCEYFTDSFWPDDYPYYCKECTKHWAYDFRIKEYILMPE